MKNRVSSFAFAVFFLLLTFGVFLSPVGYNAVRKLSAKDADASAQIFTKSNTDLYGRYLAEYGHVRTAEESTDADAVSAESPLRQFARDSLRSARGIREAALDRFTELQDRINRDYGTKYCLKVPFLLSKKTLDKAMGMNMTTSQMGTGNEITEWQDLVLELEDGMLSFIMDDTDVEVGLEKAVEFGKRMQSQGRDFLYFITPSKGRDVSEKYRGVYRDYAPELTKKLTDALSANGLCYVNYQDEIGRSGKPQSEYYFRTDHHWLPQVALDADKLLARTLNEQFGYSIDESVYDLSNYTVEYTSYDFLGTQGQKVTSVYTEPERMPLLVPKYPTDLDVFITTKGKAHGPIEEVLLDTSLKDTPNGDLHTASPYPYYGYGDQKLVQIRNNDVHDGRHVLILKTSFARPMYCFLPNIAEYIDIIDPRHFLGSVERYIELTDPKTVLVICGAGPLFDPWNEDAGLPSFFCLD